MNRALYKSIDMRDADCLFIGEKAAAAARVFAELGYAARLIAAGEAAGLMAEKLPCVKMVHIGSMEEELMGQLARSLAPEHTVSIDASRMSGEGAASILPCADIFFGNRASAKALGESEEAACRRCCAGGARLACITLGENGSIAFDGKNMLRERAIAARAVDTALAGEGFRGAFLFCRMRKMSLEETLRFCSTFAGMLCESSDGRLPTEDETLARMAKDMI